MTPRRWLYVVAAVLLLVAAQWVVSRLYEPCQVPRGQTHANEGC